MLMRYFRLSRYQKLLRRLSALVESQAVQVELLAQVVALEQAQVLVGLVGLVGQQELRQLKYRITRMSQLCLLQQI
jgi:hypothetical protein